MPTNLPPEALKKWEEYSEAQSPEEKLRKLQEFYSLMPKHKGTEKLEKFVKRRMSELRDEIERQKAAKSKRGGFAVEKRGAAQMVLIGFTNSGRSTVLSKLTNANPLISPYPFTTVEKPEEGMMEFKGAQIQVVEAPPIVPDGGKLTNLAISLSYNSDILGIVLDGRINPVDQFNEIASILEKYNISLKKPRGVVRVIRSKAAPGIIVKNKGRILDGSEYDVRKILENYGVRQAWVEIEGEVSLSDVEESVLSEKKYKPFILFVTHADDELAKKNVEALRKLGVLVIPVDLSSEVDREFLGEYILKELNLIRVYTKSKAEKGFSERALVVRRGTTAREVARIIHKDLYENFRYAKVWSKRLPYSPMRVGPDFELEDGDAIEIIG
ncbi:TGS domain-containing protein [Candidatus Methanodesulfokora washburnensis]|uniref:TGS domain-containing protein n=1 Tax=Candidatus Methanodesulfokora washburnensis TaxID=2478471 RepID=A0A3R9QUP5_9CREN|nr:TGS domain-containing protein [Candidatus Methanodesulfokores washburnensis]RSN72562.1 TGS domain-containing protein [Candidatus Methanodesulfokores washburnensis]